MAELHCPPGAGIDTIGMGLDGVAGLSVEARRHLEAATVLLGPERHLRCLPQHPARRLVFSDPTRALPELRAALAAGERVAVLTSGDPLFFGLGRVLLAQFPPDCLSFHPHLSAVQLAFNRLKVPWHDACTVSAHGRTATELQHALQRGEAKIAVLTDPNHSPAAIARLYRALDLPHTYRFWVCENLGGSQERVAAFSPEALQAQAFDPLNVVVLLRQEPATGGDDLAKLPQLGLPDRAFASFADRPGLMTKREVRILALGELALHPGQTVWDIGAGTGAVAIEIARAFPGCQVYAIERSAAGQSLIEQNCQRLQADRVMPVWGTAPDALASLPAPDRVFVGGSGGNIAGILEACSARLTADGIVVGAFATLEHLHASLDWLAQAGWSYRLLQAQLARSVPIGRGNRLSPLNPVTMVVASRHCPAVL
ncbi:MAG: cobalamin biosynthesis bifunctional protein CbiET [Cyanobacteria bacterium QS_8_64_29]|nr:MAG: cobalamin biosynthesis bifunctional protein CbiET [Cyanobacteria bacterium QS_8_64_29]